MLLVSFCNASKRNRLATIDYATDKIKFIKGGPKHTSGVTGLVKTDTGYIAACQSERGPQSHLWFLNKSLKTVKTMELKLVQDIHSMILQQNEALCVSSGDNSIYSVPLITSSREGLIYQLYEKDEDVIHLNSIALDSRGNLYASLFGELKEGQRQGAIVKAMDYIKDKDRCQGYKGIAEPHTLKIDGDNISFCESRAMKFMGFEGKEIELHGYTRGMDYNKQFYFVGNSRARTLSKSTGQNVLPFEKDTHCGISIIDRETNKEVSFMNIDGVANEIYDIVIME